MINNNGKIIPTTSSSYSRSVVSDSATPWTAACQASLSFSSPRVCLNPCPLSWWCCPTTSSCHLLIHLSQHQGLFQVVSWPSGGQSIGVSVSASVLPMNIQDWFPLWWTGWISLQSKGLSSLLQHHSSKASVLWHSAFFIVQLSHIHDDWKNQLWLDRSLLVK